MHSVKDNIPLPRKNVKTKQDLQDLQDEQDEESRLEIFFGLWYTLNVRPRERDNNKIGQAQLGAVFSGAIFL